MNPELWQKIKPILASTTDCPEWRRQQILDEACGGDDELRREVESLLEHEETLADFLEEPAVPLRAQRPDAAGRSFGPYRTVRLLGRGGMGAVYLAIRESDFEQQVALKLIEGALSDDLIGRFRNERQILARLEHPHIARLLDGGAGDDGTPYFVMEYVDGEPLDRYCDRARLSTRQRLELFLKVCSALAFAHQNLVIHRDLKPGNILVDASGTPKLLDFGIAKLLRPELDLRAAATLPGLHPLTLHYASPELVQQQPVTPASDIYSLGLVLHKLLTGRLPCGLQSTGFAQLTEVIRSAEPARPSELVGKTEEIPTGDGESLLLTPESVSRTRDGDPRKLRRRLAGDVDSIVLKALHKRPQRRYASVEQLADDVRRHLGGLPVAAREGTLVYRTGKFVRRNRWSLAAAATVLALITGFAFDRTLQLEKTSHERDRAEQVSAFLVDLFRFADPDRSPGGGLTAREILDRGREDLATGLEAKPTVRAALLTTLGQVYIKLGDYAVAAELLQEAVAILRQERRGDLSSLAMAIDDLAVATYWMGDYERAEPLLREAIAMRRLLDDDAGLIKPMNNLASILMGRGELDEAEELYRQNLARRRALYGDRDPDVATSLRHVATVLYHRGDLDGAEPLLLEALDIRRETFGARSTAVAYVLSSLGKLAQARGRHEEAEARLREALDIRLEHLGEDSLHVAITRKDLADALLARGQWATGQPLLTRALDTLRRTRAEGDWIRADAESVLGAYLTTEGRYQEAEASLLPSYRTLVEALGSRAEPRAARRRLIELYQAWGKPDKAAEFRADQ